MVFFFFLIGSLSLLWFITGLKMNKTDPNNEIEKALKIKEAYYGEKQSSNK